ncbi:ENR1 protein, partial [Tricholaema leucomelas]|nr:ENR1 protein [Tricholaema leucomelas]
CTKATVCYRLQKGSNPFKEIAGLKDFWENSQTSDSAWQAPDGLFWICGKRAYTELPGKWKGVCTIGIIQPAFFLLPKARGGKNIRDSN